MNLSAENMGKIRELVRSGYPLKARDAQDLQGHNDHLIELLEARGRLMLGAEIEIDRLKAENGSLRHEADRQYTVIEKYRAEAEALRSAAAIPANAWRVIDRKGKRFTVYTEDLAAAIAAEGLQVTPMCDLPPEGWECSRAPDHSGPCAASEVQP